MRKRICFFAAGLFFLVLTSGLTAAWQPANGPGAGVGQVNALAIMGTHLLAGTSDSGVFRSSDSGVHWLAVNNGLTTLDIKALIVRGTALFAGTYGGGVFRSTDTGAHWEAINTGISTLNIQALGGNDSFLFAGTSGGGVCRSSDSGGHWLEVSNGLVHVNIFSIGVTSRYVFVGTWGGSAFRTEDNGLNWYLVTNGLFDPRENIIPYCFAVADTFLFTGTGGGGIFRAKDSARAWYPFNTGLPDTAFVTALAICEDTLFAATHHGVFRSIANGNEALWVLDNDGLADAIVGSFAISSGTLFAGTNGSGVWRKSLSTIPLPLPEKVVAIAGISDTLRIDSLLCKWNRANPGVTGYQVEVYSDSLTGALVMSDSTISDTTLLLKDLPNNTTLWWRVRARNSAGWGLFSDGNKIIVRIPTTAVLPKSFIIAQSGPSLVNGTLRYGIPTRCVVSLTVFDISGKAIGRYASTHQQPGYYTVKLNRGSMATGRYFLRFTAGDQERVIPFFVH